MTTRTATVSLLDRAANRLGTVAFTITGDVEGDEEGLSVTLETAVNTETGEASGIATEDTLGAFSDRYAFPEGVDYDVMLDGLSGALKAADTAAWKALDQASLAAGDYLGPTSPYCEDDRAPEDMA